MRNTHVRHNAYRTLLSRRRRHPNLDPLLQKPLLNIQHRLHMLEPQPNPLLTRKQLRRLEHILNLPPIHAKLRQLIQIPLRHLMLLPKPTNLLPRIRRRDDVIMLLGAGVDEILPHVPPAGRGERLVAHGDVDARLEGRVDVVDAVRGQEKDALVVLEDAQEDGHELVALEVVRAALLEEDVGLVEQQDGVPFRAHLQHVGQVRLDFVRLGAEIAGGHHVQRRAHRLGDALGRQGLADAGRAGEKHDHAHTLALDDVVKNFLVGALGFCERKDELLMVFGEHERLESVLVEGHFFHVVDHKLHPFLVLEGVPL